MSLTNIIIHHLIVNHKSLHNLNHFLLLIAIINFNLSNRIDRKAKETQVQLDEERSNSQRLQAQVDQLNSKMKSVRRDKEEAEGEVETLQKRLRQLRVQLEESDETNSALQTQISKMRSASRRAPKVVICAQIYWCDIVKICRSIMVTYIASS